MVDKWIAIAAVLFFLASSDSLAEKKRSFLVIETDGDVLVLDPGRLAQRKLLPNTFLEKGTVLKTGSNSFVQMALSEGLEAGMKVEPHSRLDLLGLSPPRVFLKQGTLLVLRDREILEEAGGPVSGGGERPFAPALRVLTRDGWVETRYGGCQIQVSERGTAVRVFDGEAAVSASFGKGEKPFAVREGFKCFLGSKKPPVFPFRMGFEDYARWEVWMREFYEKRDDLTF